MSYAIQDEKKIYSPIPDVENFVLSLVNNIYNDGMYQKYLTRMEASENETHRKKADIIKKTFTDIQVFNNQEQPLVLARDVGILMGVSQINAIIKRFDENETTEGYIRLSNGRLKKTYFLTRYGVYRVFLSSRSKLSKVFRNFIYALLDHMIVHENKMLKEIVNKFQTNNPDMIRESIVDLHGKYLEFKELLEREKKEKHTWQSAAEAEHAAKLEIEKERDEIDIINMYNMNDLHAIRQTNDEYMNEIRELSVDIQLNKFNDTYVEDELNLLKNKYLREVQIYAITPTYLQKMYTDTMNPKIDRNFVNEYIKMYNIVVDNEMRFELDEMLLLYVVFGKKIMKTSKKFHHIATEYVYDKPTFVELLDTLQTEAEYLKLTDKPAEYVYKTTLEDVKLTVHELLLRSGSSSI